MKSMNAKFIFHMFVRWFVLFSFLHAALILGAILHFDHISGWTLFEAMLPATFLFAFYILDINFTARSVGGYTNKLGKDDLRRMLLEGILCLGPNATTNFQIIDVQVRSRAITNEEIRSFYATARELGICGLLMMVEDEISPTRWNTTITLNNTIVHTAAFGETPEAALRWLVINYRGFSHAVDDLDKTQNQQE